MKGIFFAASLFAIVPFVFLFTLIIALIIYRQPHTVSYGNAVAYAALPTTQNVLSATITQNDGRVESIRQFLTKYNSPLEPYTNDIVNAAIQYGLDDRLIVAIAMQESGLCKKIPENSFNCWGFGIYGKNVTRFSDYKEGIYTVSKALATKYKDKGLVTPEEIMTMYTPSSDGSWAFSVNHFMAQMN